MKAKLYFIILGIALGSCSLFTKVGDESSQKQTQPAGYLTTIVDPYFDKWYQMNYSASMDRDGTYYKTSNYHAANNWNEYYRRGQYPNHISSMITYIPNADYDLEVDRRLYWYFKYMQQEYKIRLLH